MSQLRCHPLLRSCATLLCTGVLLFPALSEARLFGSMRNNTDEVPSNFPAKGNPDTAQQRTIMAGGLERTYLIQKPAGNGPFPLVVLLHGGTQTASQVWAETSLPTLAARDNFILVAPNGVNKHWNDGRGAVLGGSGSTADDVGFLRSVISQVVAQDHADPRAVFMVGPSNGGFMTQYFACQSAETLRAAANVISDLPVSIAQKCKPSKALPWLSINGTADPLIPFAGQGEGVVKNGQEQPALLSADLTFKFWADHAGCSAQVETTRFQGADGKWVEKRVRRGCNGAPYSVQYVCYGSGHVWPGTPIRLAFIRRIIGQPTMAFDSGTVIWDFFKSTLGR